MVESINKNGPITGKTAEALVSQIDAILEIWSTKVLISVAPKVISKPVLIDTLPVFLNNLAEALSHSHSRKTATDSNNVAQEHGGERARVTTFNPEQIIQEYRILRKVVITSLNESARPSAEELDIINDSFDQGVQDAVSEYFLVHNSLRERFVATLTHDLRNPLGAAKMSADLLKMDLEDDNNVSADAKVSYNLGFERIIRNIRRVDELIQSLLDTHSDQAGEKLHLEIIECDALEIVKTVASDLPLEDQSRFQVVGSTTAGFWDPDAVRRALANLVSNGFKYGAENSPICVRISERLGRVIFSVHNEGNPIPLEEQVLLFQPFHRSKSARQSGKKGWGLGLSQVRAVAESHGGSLTVDSGKDGTTFTFDIPQDAKPFQKN